MWTKVNDEQIFVAATIANAEADYALANNGPVFDTAAVVSSERSPTARSQTHHAESAADTFSAQFIATRAYNTNAVSVARAQANVNDMPSNGILLSVPSEQTHVAKHHGARWDPRLDVWWANPHGDIETLRMFMPSKPTGTSPGQAAGCIRADCACTVPAPERGTMS